MILTPCGLLLSDVLHAFAMQDLRHIKLVPLTSEFTEVPKGSDVSHRM